LDKRTAKKLNRRKRREQSHDSNPGSALSVFSCSTS
jgi:hypothetical protein